MLVPTKNNILVTLIETEKKQGMLIVPEEKKEFLVGIIAPGCGQPDALLDGYYVWFRRFSGFPIEYDGVKYICLKTEDVMAVSSVLK